MIKYYLLFFVFISTLLSQTIYTERDVDICNSKFELAVDKNLSPEPINNVIIDIAKSFLGLDYQAHTLEVGDEEKLVINLGGLDCYTFLESALVFARCIKLGDTSFDCYQKQLENIRYRGGKLKDYTSRLHYFSDWIYDMDKRGIVEDVTEIISGIRYYNSVNFMSRHPDSYKRLSSNPGFVSELELIEKEISSREYYYIPQDSISKVEQNILSGDILGMTTNINGLDISHTGIAIKLDDDRIHLLHAPNVGKKIQISEVPLAEYIQNIGHQTGIIVARPKPVN